MSTATFFKDEWGGDPKRAEEICHHALEAKHLEDWNPDEDEYHDGRPISRYAVAVGQTNGELKVHYREGPCHSALNSFEGPNVALVTAPATESWFDPEDWGGGRHDYTEDGRFLVSTDYERAFSTYWDWLTKESRWSRVFLNHPSLSDLGVKGVSINTRLPSNFVVQALIGTRQPHEYPDRIILWRRIVDQGGDPELALLLAESYDVDQGTGHLDYYPSGDIHDMFNIKAMGKVATRNFIENRFVNPNADLYENGSYGGIHKLYGALRSYEEYLYDRKPSYLEKKLKPLYDSKRDVERYVFGKGTITEEKKSLSFDGGAKTLADLTHELKEKLSNG